MIVSIKSSNRIGALLVVTGMIALPLSSCKKSSSSSSGAAAAPTSYAGTWTAAATSTANTGTCTSGASQSTQMTVTSGGAASFNTGVTSGTGTVNMTSGVWSVTLTDAQCGNGTASGTCSSFTSCTGTFQQGTYASQAAGSSGSEQGTIAITR